MLTGFSSCRQPPAGKIDVPLAGISCWTHKNEVRDLAFSGSNVIWAATGGGLLKFDLRDRQWTSFTMADGLPSNNVLSILSTSKGDLWVGTDRGAARLDGRTLTCYGPGSGLQSLTVNVFAEGVDGTLYAGTERGIARFNGKKWEPFEDTHEFARRAVCDIARDIDGTFWFAKENSLTHYLGGSRWETFQKNVLRPDEKVGLIFNSLLSIAVDASGTKWIGTKAGLAGYDGHRWRKYYYHERMAVGKGLKDNWIETVTAAPGGLIWIGHGNSRDFDQPVGAAYSRGGKEWSYLTTADGLPSDKVYKIKTGPEGDVWIASANGMARVDGGQVEKFPPPDGIRSNHVVSLLSGEGGRVVALLATGAVVFESSTVRDVPSLDGQSLRAGTVLDGVLFCAGMRGGLFAYIRSEGWKEDDFFTGKKIIHLDIEEGMIRLVAEDGLYRGRPGNWMEIPLTDAPAGFRPLKSFKAPDGRIWITGRLDYAHGKEKAVLLTACDGRLMNVDLPSLAAPFTRLNNLIFDGDGYPWLVSPAGLYVYRGKWSELPLPLKKGDLSAASWDNEGRLWVGTREGGLFLYDGKNWIEMIIGGNPAPAWINSIAAQENVIWFGTAGQGLFRLDLRTVGY